MLKPIKKRELIESLEYRQVFFSDQPAHHKHSIDGLSKLVTEQSGQRPEKDAAYIFTVKGNDNIKILMPDEGMNSVIEMQGERAREIVRVCNTEAV